jgi:hypothetical protein
VLGNVTDSGRWPADVHVQICVSQDKFWRQLPDQDGAHHMRVETRLEPDLTDYRRTQYYYTERDVNTVHMGVKNDKLQCTRTSGMSCNLICSKVRIGCTSGMKRRHKGEPFLWRSKLRESRLRFHYTMFGIHNIQINSHPPLAVTTAIALHHFQHSMR